MARTLSSSASAELQPSSIFPGLCVGCEGDAGVALQPEASGLKNRRNGSADDVLTVLGKVGVTAGGKRAKLTAAVAEKGNLEHVDCGAWRARGARFS